MTRDEFDAAVKSRRLPDDIGHALAAMWYDAVGEWEKAHSQAQAQEDATGAWVHAYLHRVEGDQSNAAYWYRRAGRPECKDSLSEERDVILSSLLLGA
ncbi:MAG: hypothetical protein ACK2UO_16335 [Caldilineaceae bacterium]